MKTWLAAALLGALLIDASAAPSHWEVELAFKNKIEEADRELRGGFDILAIQRLEEAAKLVGGRADRRLALADAYVRAGRPETAARHYIDVAFAAPPGFNALAGVGLSRIFGRLTPTDRYRSRLAAGDYTAAIEEAPWLPAAYWAAALQAQLDGSRSRARRMLKRFHLTMLATGLDRPYRDWTIESFVMRYQVDAVEVGFLADAGFIPRSWRDKVGPGARADIARAFGAVDADIWRAAGEAMRHTLRFKTLRVAPNGGGDHRSIQAAVDALSRSGGGGAISVAPGTYRESVVIEETARVVLHGEGDVRVESSEPHAAAAA